MTATFHIPARFHPGYSLLGRRVRRAVDDPWRAETCLILLLTILVMAWTVIQALVWALWHPPAFWALQAGGLLLLFATCGWGVEPAARVTCGPDGLRIHQGRRALALPYAAVTGVHAIAPRRFHRHYRRYAAARVFVNRIPPRLLLLETTRGPVVLGLAPEDQDAFRTLFRERDRVPSLE